MYRYRLSICAAAILAVSGCASATGSARHVLVEQGRGVVAMPITGKGYDDRSSWQKAVQLIREKCGPDYTITREEEVAVG